MVTYQTRKHSSEAEILELVEMLEPGDKLQVTKNIGFGYHVEVIEAEPPRPPREFEG